MREPATGSYKCQRGIWLICTAPFDASYTESNDEHTDLVFGEPIVIRADTPHAARRTSQCLPGLASSLFIAPIVKAPLHGEVLIRRSCEPRRRSVIVELVSEVMMEQQLVHGGGE